MAAAGERGLIVAVAPDGGSKYLSTQLWSGFGPVDYEI
jgi:hypothetical protein